MQDKATKKPSDGELRWSGVTHEALEALGALAVGVKRCAPTARGGIILHYYATTIEISPQGDLLLAEETLQIVAEELTLYRRVLTVTGNVTVSHVTVEDCDGASVSDWYIGVRAPGPTDWSLGRPLVVALSGARKGAKVRVWGRVVEP